MRKAGVALVVGWCVLFSVCAAEAQTWSWISEPWPAAWGHHVLQLPAFNKHTPWYSDTARNFLWREAWGATTVTKTGSVGLKVVKGLELVVGPTKYKILGRIAIEAALLAASYYLPQWLAEHEWMLDGDGRTVMKPVGAWVATPGHATGTWQFEYGGATYKVMALHPGSGEAQTACAADRGSACTWDGFAVDGWADQWQAYRYGEVVEGHTTNKFYVYGPSPDWVEWEERTPEPVPVAELETALENGTSEAWKGMMQEGLRGLAWPLNYGNQTWPGGDIDPGVLTPEQFADATNALDDCLTPEQKDLIDGGDDDLPEDTPTVPLEIDWGTFTAPSTIPNEEPQEPEKKNLTEKLEGYQESLQGLPVVGWLTSYQINLTGAACSMMAPTPWGEVTFDLCEYGAVLDTLGGIMLAFCGLVWLMYLFKHE